MKTLIAALILSSIATIAHSQCSKSGLMDEGIFKDNALVKRTDTIKAEIGTQFGFTYCASGLPNNAVYEMEYKLSHPPMLLTDGTIRTVLSQIHKVRSKNGILSDGVGFRFDELWELAPGVWTMDVRHNNHVILSRKFTVK